MCKQEDYFKNWSTCTTKNIFPCHASTGRPKPCRALGWGTTERSRFTSLTENSGSNQQSASEAKRKAILMLFYSRKHFSLRKSNLVDLFKTFFLPVCFSGWEGEKTRCLWQDGKKKKVGEEANFWNVHFPTPPPKNYNIQSIPIAHWSCQQRVKMLSVHVAIKKTNPPCTVLRKYSGGLMRSRGFSSCC